MLGRAWFIIIIIDWEFNQNGIMWDSWYQQKIKVVSKVEKDSAWKMIKTNFSLLLHNMRCEEIFHKEARNVH